MLAAAPRVDVGAARNVAAGLGEAAREGDEVAGALEHLGLGDEIEVGVRRVGDVAALGRIDHPEKPTGNRPRKQT